MIQRFESLARFRKAALKAGLVVIEEMGRVFEARDKAGFPRGSFMTYRFMSGWLADSYEEWKAEYIREVEELQGGTQEVIDIRKGLPLEDGETQEDRDEIIARFVAGIPEDEAQIQHILDLRLAHIAKIERKTEGFINQG